eukprot:1160718-Pelagomonas_calceolata.AAC.4
MCDPRVSAARCFRQGPFEPPNQPRGLLPETEEPQPPKIEGPRSLGGGLQRQDGGAQNPMPSGGGSLPSIGGALPSVSGNGPQAQAKQVCARPECPSWCCPETKKRGRCKSNLLLTMSIIRPSMDVQDQSARDGAPKKQKQKQLQSNLLLTMSTIRPSGGVQDLSAHHGAAKK